MKSKNCFYSILCIILIAGCGPMATSNYPTTSNYPSGGYGSPTYGSPYNDDYYARRERDRLHDERERLREERRRLEREKENLALQNELHNSPQPLIHKEQCPHGFHETERKCSDSERKRGCKDIKMTGGLRCINR